MGFTDTGVWLALLAFCAGANLSLGIKNHYELNESGKMHFIIFGILIMFVLTHPVFLGG